MASKCCSFCEASETKRIQARRRGFDETFRSRLSPWRSAEWLVLKISSLLFAEFTQVDVGNAQMVPMMKGIERGVFEGG